MSVEVSPDIAQTGNHYTVHLTHTFVPEKHTLLNTTSSHHKPSSKQHKGECKSETTTVTLEDLENSFYMNV